MGNGDDDGVGLAKKLSTHQNIDTPFYGVLCFQEIDFFSFERWFLFVFFIKFVSNYKRLL